jgi:hypothetical protein
MCIVQDARTGVKATAIPAPSADVPPPAAELVTEVTETLRLLVGPEQVFELRALPDAEYRRFNLDSVSQAAEWAAGQAVKSKTVYVTLNPLAGTCDATGRAACDADVLGRRWLLVDADPVRPPDVSSTDEEKAHAKERVLAVRDWLAEQGFPEPVLADSGNGFHLLYRIDLPAADQGIVKRALRALAAKFDDGAVKIDTRVSNASRITKLYGTVARKGPGDRDRPHRKSAVLSVPPELRAIPTDRLESVAAQAATEGPAGSGPKRRRPVPVPEIPREEVRRRARGYVEKMPSAVSGQGGHDQTFAVACRLVRGFGLTPAEARPVLEEFNRRCQPPWEPWELDHKLEDADVFDGPRGLYLVEFSNYREGNEEERSGWSEKVGLSSPIIAEKLFGITDGWPRKAGGALFVPGPDFKPTWLPDHRSLFAWIQGQFPPRQHNPVTWVEGADKVTKAEFHTYLTQTAQSYDAVEPAPHHPQLSGHFYLHHEVGGGDGKALQALLARFNPATDVDRQLIKAMFLTPFWGGPGGTRPAFLITCEDEDESKGRGVGKTSLAEMVGLLAGGTIHFSKEESPEAITKRLISPAALDMRVVLLDNLKTLKFSSEVLEGLLTAAVVSGWKLYQGHGSRPNTLTYLLTINGASLSKDMAQRCVIIKLRRPVHSGDWARETRGFIESRRWEIIGDILAELRRDVPPLESVSRWGQWEQAVLSSCDDPADCLRLIEERRGEVDGDQDEADQVRDVFIQDLRKRGFDPDTAVVWYAAEAVRRIVNHATGEIRSTNKATAYLNNLAIKEIKRDKKFKGDRGHHWKGAKSSPEEQPVRYDSTGKPGVGY